MFHAFPGFFPDLIERFPGVFGFQVRPSLFHADKGDRDLNLNHLVLDRFEIEMGDLGGFLSY